MMKKSVVAGVVFGLLVGCTANQQAALPVVATMMNPSADAGDKTCAVLAWGIPIAKERIGTLTPNQLLIAADAEKVMLAACVEQNMSWKQRAVSAAVMLADVLWDKVR